MFFNFPLVTSIIAIVLAQLIKLPLNYLINREFTPSILLSTGGMPSSHSAFVTALVISIGLESGIYTNEFAIAFVLAGVVVHDAMGIRREAGKHATVLNKMGEDIEFILHSLAKGKHKNKALYEEKFKELLGHEPSEAFGGVLLGAVVAFICFIIKISI